MDTGLFKEKLARLNPDLYLDMNHRIYSVNPQGTSGIYLKRRKYEPIDASVLDEDGAKLAACYNNSNEIYVGWATHGYVSEGDIFDEKGKVISRGWRTTIKNLSDRGFTNKDRAQRIFRWTESDYDRMNYKEKMEFEKRFLCQQP